MLLGGKYKCIHMFQNHGPNGPNGWFLSTWILLFIIHVLQHLKTATQTDSVSIHRFAGCKAFWTNQMEVSWNGGTPSHHPFRTMGCSFLNHPAFGVPPWLRKPPNYLNCTFSAILGMISHPLLAAAQTSRVGLPANQWMLLQPAQNPKKHRFW